MVAWLEGYQYRVKIPIINNVATALSDYPIKLRILRGEGTSEAGIIYLQYNTFSWPNDIRFTSDDGLTPLYIWREESDDTDGTWWVCLDYIDASATKDLYLYYGKASDSDSSDGNNTFSFFDDFEDESLDGGKWATSGTVTETGGVSSVAGNPGYIMGKTAFATGYSVRMKSKNTITQSDILGWTEATLTTLLDIRSNGTGTWWTQAQSSVINRNIAMDSDYHIFEVNRLATDETVFIYDEDGDTTYTDTTTVSGADLKPFVYSLTTAINISDYILIRKIVSSEPSWASPGTVGIVGEVDEAAQVYVEYPNYQDIKYSITAINSGGTHSVERFFITGEISEEINSVPTAQLVLSDKNRTLSNIPDGILPPTESFWIAISASTNSGYSWNRLFIGGVERYNISLDPSGQRHVSLDIYDAPELRYNYITPNQIAIGNCNFGELFMGTVTASDGTIWASDIKGNYPNGLLYDTNLIFASPSDIYADVPDAPFKIAYNNNKKIDVIKNWLVDYGMCFRVDTRYKKFYIQHLPSIQTFPDSGHVVRVGETVNKYNKEINLADFNSCVTLIGADNTVFDTYGTGTKEKLIINSEILSHQSARDLTKRFYSSSLNIPLNYEATIPPLIYPILGKSIHFEEIDGDSETLSVVSVVHSLDERWETNLVFENPLFENAKTIVQIQDELSKLSQSDLEGEVYVRASSGESTYHQAEGSGTFNICAIGLGTGRDTDSTGSPYTDSGIDGPLLIKPVNVVLSDTIGTNSFYSAYATIAPTEANRLIRSMVLFANDNTESNRLYYHSRILTVGDRPLTEWNTSMSSTIYRNMGVCQDNYFSHLESIVPSSPYSDCLAYPRTAKDFNVKYINDWTTSDYPPGLTSTEDGAESGDNLWNHRGRFPTDNNVSAMSRDMRMNSWNYSVASFTNVTVSEAGVTSSTGKDVTVLFEYSMPISPESEAWKYIARIDFGFHCWGTYSHADANGYSPILLYWNKASTNSDDTAWRCLGTISNNYGCTFYSNSLYLGKAVSSTYAPTNSFTLSGKDMVDSNSGKMYFALRMPPPAGYTLATNTMYIQYAAMTAHIKNRNLTGSGDTIDIHRFEKCMIDETGRLQLAHNPKSILGIYATADYSSSIDAWVKQDAATNLLPSAKWRSDNEILQMFKPKNKKTYDGLTNKHRRGASLKTQYDYYDWSTPVYLYADANQSTSISSFLYKTIVENRYVFVEYTSEYADTAIKPPPEILTNIISCSYSNRGKSASFYMDISNAPGGYWSNLRLNYYAVGSGTDGSKGGTIGKALFHIDTESSIREGVDKNIYKTLNLQYDWYGDVSQVAGSVDGAVGVQNAINDRANHGYRRNHTEWWD